MEQANVIRGLQDDTLNPASEAPPPPEEATNPNAKSPVRHRRRRRRRRNKWCPCLYMFIIPPLTLIGGFIFLMTERDRNIKDIAEYKDRCKGRTEDEKKLLLKNITFAFNHTESHKLTAVLEQRINRSITEVDDCLRNFKKPKPPYVFDFIGCMVYSVSIFATIGYGDLVPVTVGGRVATLIYSMIGVPLYISFCADLGEWTADRLTCIAAAARNAYRRKNLGRALTQEEADEPLSQWTIFLIVLTLVIVYSTAASAAVMALEDAGGKHWSFLDSLYFFHISITLIGFGDLTPTHEYYLCVHLPLIIIGQTLLALIFYSIQKVVRYRVPKWISSGCLSLANRYDTWVRDRKSNGKAEESSSGSANVEAAESQQEGQESKKAETEEQTFRLQLTDPEPRTAAEAETTKEVPKTNAVDDAKKSAASLIRRILPWDEDDLYLDTRSISVLSPRPRRAKAKSI